MNRRTFIWRAGATSLGLTGRIALSQPPQPVAQLLELLEEAPRERTVRELALSIRAGLRYEDLLTALTLAAVRDVQPYPDVGFKYHSVMVLRSIDATTRQLPAAERWLPILWAADYFKETQAQERAAGGWRMPASPPLRQGQLHGPQASEDARKAFVTAMDTWDRSGADAAVVRYAATARPAAVFSLLFPYGARDLRAIGHKAIAVSNAHHLISSLGSSQAEAILRSTVAALQNSDSDADPAHHDWSPDRPGRRNRERLGAIPGNWRAGRDDPGARAELRQSLYRVSEDDAGDVVVQLLRAGISPDAIWQVLFGTAAELILHQPGIVQLHAQTTANALHYAFRVSEDVRTQQLMLLQCAAFIAMFRHMAGGSAQDLDLATLDAVSPHHCGEGALQEIFEDLAAGERLSATRKTLGYLNSGGDPPLLIAAARHHLVYNAVEPHDYKFAEAVFDNYAHTADSPWARRFLSAGMGYFKAPGKRRPQAIEEAMRLLPRA